MKAERQNHSHYYILNTNNLARNNAAIPVPKFDVVGFGKAGAKKHQSFRRYPLDFAVRLVWVGCKVTESITAPW